MTISRRIISSASSRAVHWVIGRAESSGCSHASAVIRQTCSAVIRAGVPGRGTSSSRSSTVKSSNARGWRSTHRRRHSRTVSHVTWKRRAISALLWPSAAPKTIRARHAMCWRTWCRRTNCCSACCSRSLNSSGIGLDLGILPPCSRRPILSDLSPINKRLI